MLILYYRPTCPYCQKVLYEAKQLKDIAFELRDICEVEHVNELKARGGKQQVPYLIDEERNVEMYESDDIVEYLREHYESR